MFDIIMSNRFKKDLKITVKRGYDIGLFDKVVTKLANGENLPEKNKDNELL